MIAINRAARGIHEPAHPGIAIATSACLETVDIAGVRTKRIQFNERGHRSQRGLMQHPLDTGTRALAIIEVGDVAFLKTETSPLLFRDLALYVVEVVSVSGR